MKSFSNYEIMKFLGRLGNKWGTGHESVTKILSKIRKFLDKKKDRIKFLDKVLLLVEMLEAYSEGKYEIDDGSLGLIISCLAYLALPTDIIPDFIMVAGFTDDAAAFALVFNQLSEEIDRFKSWKEVEELESKESESKDYIEIDI